MSRFELTLPGNKELSVLLVVSVNATRSDGKTVATVMLMTGQISFTWT